MDVGGETVVEPATNRAEGALRCSVLWHWMMQGAYTVKDDRWEERILARREACRRRGIPHFLS